MKRIKKGMCVFVAVTFLTMMTMGCAGNRTLDPNYLAYSQNVQAQVQAQAKQPPLIDLSVSADGKIEGLKVYVPPENINVEQYRRPAPHPGWALATKAVGVLGVLGGIYLAGQALEGIVEASGSTTTTTNYTNSGNEVGGDMTTTTIDMNTTNSVTGDGNTFNADTMFDYTGGDKPTTTTTTTTTKK